MAKPGSINRNRVLILLFIFALCGVFVLGRMAFLMLFWADENLDKASNQWVREARVSAQRGNITDRNGEVVAGSASCDMVVLFPATLSKYGDAGFALSQLADILEMDLEAIRKRFETNMDRGQIELKRQISRSQTEAINTLLASSADKNHPYYRKMRGVKLVEDTKRYYPMGDFMTQVLGFTNVDGDGLEGVEAKYNKYLTGMDGLVMFEKDGNGLELYGDIGVETYVAPKNGYNVVLTLDTVIQGFAEKAAQLCMQEQNAVAVRCLVLDPRTCEVLANVNLPDYDNNNPPRTDLALLTRLSRNGCIAEAYEPGGIFEILTAAAALELGKTSLNQTYSCPGFAVVDGHKIQCWGYQPHENQNLTQAVEHSCTPAFTDMALAMGTDAFYDKLYDFGLGAPTGVGLYGESSGTVTASKYIHSTDLARIGFGQSIAVTPIQLAVAVSSVINGGNLMQPYVVREITNAQGQAVQQFVPQMVQEHVISRENSQIMRQILQSVVDRGSGCNGAVEGYAVGGMAGTSSKYGADGRIISGRYVSSYCGFAPADDPQVLVLLVVDEPGGVSPYGSIVAAPYVSSILEDILQYLGVPQTRSYGREEVGMPSVLGMAPELAASQLETLGLRVEMEGSGSSVADQMPQEGTMVERGSTVVLGMDNAGDVMEASQVLVPELRGLAAAEALEALKSRGLRMRIRGNGSHVENQTPQAGTVLYPGDTVLVDFPPKMDPAPSPSPSTQPE